MRIKIKYKIKIDGDDYSCFDNNGRMGCFHRTTDECEHSCHKQNTKEADGLS